jgi:hypothetical protein
MAGFFRRRPRLPDALRPALDPDERVLAWAGTRDGGAVVATSRGLWLPGRARLGWHAIHKAAWSGDELRITPAEVAEERPGYAVQVDAPMVAYPLADPGDLPDQVRTRVTRSVSWTTHHPLPGGGGVRVVGRRISGVDGLRWAVRYDAGTAADAADVVRATDDLVSAARATVAAAP